jgi:hypothetical protein
MDERHMNPLDELTAATHTAQREDEFPDFLAERIFAIVNRLRDRQVLQAEVEELTEQVVLYDTYAQTGYIGMGVNHLILEGTIHRLEEKIKAANI